MGKRLYDIKYIVLHIFIVLAVGGICVVSLNNLVVRGILLGGVLLYFAIGIKKIWKERKSLLELEADADLEIDL